MVQIHINRYGDLIALRQAGNNAYYPVGNITYKVGEKNKLTISAAGRTVFAGEIDEAQVGETILAQTTAEAILSALLFVDTGVTDTELAALLTDALNPDRVVRADDNRALHSNVRRHGISDIENCDGLPVNMPGTIINAAHAGFRNGSNRFAEQLFLPQDRAALYVRKANDGKWSGWVKVLTSTDDQVGNIDEFGEFISIVNKTQANKPGNRNGMLLSLPYNVYRPENKYGNQIYFTEVEGEMYFRTKTNNAWGVWKRVLSTADRIGEKVTLTLNLNASTGITIALNGGVAKFIGYRQANGEYFGFVQVDAAINFATSANWNGVTLVSLPEGWQLAESHQACGDLFTTGTGGHFWKLWSECDEPGSTALIKSWNNNADIPRGTALRLMYNFPCIIREIPPAA
jgi:hypothetical protein